MMKASLQVLSIAYLMRIICDEIRTDVKANGLPLSSTNDKVHAILSIALLCKRTHRTALDELWRELSGFLPLLRLFKDTHNRCGQKVRNDLHPRKLENSPSTHQILPPIISTEEWDTFDEYTERVQTFICGSSSRSSYASTVYMRFAGHTDTIFPNLRTLRVDAAFAAEPAITLLYASDRLSNLELVLERDPSVDVVYGAVSSAAEHVPLLDRLSITARQPGTQTFSSLCSAIALRPRMFALRHLAITSHPIDASFLRALSRFESLESLNVSVAGRFDHANGDGDGFEALTSLDITASIEILPNILRTLHQGILERLQFTDLSGYDADQQFPYMLELHELLDSRFGMLRGLGLFFPVAISPGTQNSQHEAILFAPLLRLSYLRVFVYRGDFQPTLSADVQSRWENLRVLDISTSSEPYTPSVLPTLAKRYPHLIHLALPVEFPADAQLDSDGPVSHHLQTLTLRGIPSVAQLHPSKIAAFLDGIFPFLATVRGEGNLKEWVEVKNILLDGCQRARELQRARDREFWYEHSRVLDCKCGAQ